MTVNFTRCHRLSLGKMKMVLVALTVTLLIETRPSSTSFACLRHDSSRPCRPHLEQEENPQLDIDMSGTRCEKLFCRLMYLRGGMETGANIRGSEAGDLDMGGGYLEALPDSSDIPSEGTATPGDGVIVKEGYTEKKRREHAWAQMPEEHAKAERIIYPTWDDAVIMREQWFAENPDIVEPLNETWFFEIRRGNLTTIRSLVQQGAQIEWEDDFGDRAIHLAAIDNRTELALLLLSFGASINAKNKRGNTALHIATEYAQIEMMQQLIAAGANLEERNRGKATALVTACVHGHAACIRLLAAHGADIHTRALKLTPALHFAAACNHAEAIRALIELGVHANSTTPLGRNAMDWAYYSNETQAIEELSKHGVPVQDGGMLPALEIQKWAGEKRERAAAKKAGKEPPPRVVKPGGWFPQAKDEPLVIAPLVLPRRDDMGNTIQYPFDTTDLVQDS